MIIPHKRLSTEALRGIIEEVVTRDGTEQTDADLKISQVMGHLETGKLVVTYDPDTQSCNIVPASSIPED